MIREQVTERWLLMLEALRFDIDTVRMLRDNLWRDIRTNELYDYGLRHTLPNQYKQLRAIEQELQEWTVSFFCPVI